MGKNGDKRDKGCKESGVLGLLVDRGERKRERERCGLINGYVVGTLSQESCTYKYLHLSSLPRGNTYVLFNELLNNLRRSDQPLLTILIKVKALRGLGMHA